MVGSLSPRRRLLLLGATLLAAAAVVAGLLVALWPEQRTRPEGPVPVVLVHGYDGTPASFSDLASHLRAGGRQVVVVALPDRGTGDFDLVGYSAGGIVVRAYLGQPGRAAHARHVVLLASPNHGAQLAGFASLLGPQLCNGACAQLAPGSTLPARHRRRRCWPVRATSASRTSAAIPPPTTVSWFATRWRSGWCCTRWSAALRGSRARPTAPPCAPPADDPAPGGGPGTVTGVV